MGDTEYRFTIRPLTEDEGGGWLIEFPDLPGCMSDGATIEEAIANDAARAEIAASPACRARQTRRGEPQHPRRVTLLAEGLGERAAHGD
jgi:hypothetical protein